MSRRPTPEARRGQRQQRKQLARHVARVTTKAHGCSCDRPDVVGGPVHVTVLHEVGCPMRDAGRRVVLYVWSESA